MAITDFLETSSANGSTKGLLATSCLTAANGTLALSGPSKIPAASDTPSLNLKNSSNGHAPHVSSPVSEPVAATGVPCVLGIGSANPDWSFEMKDFARMFEDKEFQVPPEGRYFLDRIAKLSGISKKYSALSPQQAKSYPSLYNFGTPSLDDRLSLFAPAALKISELAATRALADWGGDRADITHIMTFSTTGMTLPALDIQLVKALNLPNTAKHQSAVFFGCHAGMVGLRSAFEIAQANPANRVLVLCVEVPSVQIQNIDPEYTLINNFVTAAIFGDGASAVVVGKPTKTERPLFEIHRCKSFVVPDSGKNITAFITQTGLLANIDKVVPKRVGEVTPAFVTELLKGTNLDCNSVAWAVHPGGKPILDVIEKECKLTPDKLQYSRDVLDQYGNMGGATILFVLEKFVKEAKKEGDNEWMVSLAVGPGISVEGAISPLDEVREGKVLGRPLVQQGIEDWPSVDQICTLGNMHCQDISNGTTDGLTDQEHTGDYDA